MNPLISFVLPAYKAKYFKEAVDSILSQTYTNFELIIVNDCSPENLDAIVAQYNDKRIRYYKNEKNIGGTDLVAQWNHCITFAIGEFLVLASDDDVYYPQYLEQLVPLTYKYSNVNIFRPRVEIIDKNGKIIDVEGYLDTIVSQLEFTWLLHRRTIFRGIPFYLFRIKALLDIGGFVSFPLGWYSDDATSIKLARNGLASSSITLFKFRSSSGVNISSDISRQTILRKINATEMFLKWINKYPFFESDEYDMLYKLKLYGSLDNCEELYGALSHLSFVEKLRTINKSELLSTKKKWIFFLRGFKMNLASLFRI